MGSLSSGVVAGCFALSAFTIAILAGLAADNPASTILFRAIAALLICWPVGYLAGTLCRRVIEHDDPMLSEREMTPAEREVSEDDADAGVPSNSEPENSSAAPATVTAEPTGR